MKLWVQYTGIEYAPERISIYLRFTITTEGSSRIFNNGAQFLLRWPRVGWGVMDPMHRRYMEADSSSPWASRASDYNSVVDQEGARKERSTKDWQVATLEAMHNAWVKHVGTTSIPFMYDEFLDMSCRNQQKQTPSTMEYGKWKPGIYRHLSRIIEGTFCPAMEQNDHHLRCPCPNRHRGRPPAFESTLLGTRIYYGIHGKKRECGLRFICKINRFLWAHYFGLDSFHARRALA